MPKGKAKSKYNFHKGSCNYEDSNWCYLPKYKRCEHCVRHKNKSKTCKVTTLPF